jgi:hypothetical protein
MSLREQTLAGLRTSGRSAGPGEHGRPGRVRRHLADEAARTQAPREGARAPRDRRNSDTRSLKAWGHRYKSTCLGTLASQPPPTSQGLAHRPPLGRLAGRVLTHLRLGLLPRRQLPLIRRIQRAQIDLRAHPRFVGLLQLSHNKATRPRPLSRSHGVLAPPRASRMLVGESHFFAHRHIGPHRPLQNQNHVAMARHSRLGGQFIQSLHRLGRQLDRNRARLSFQLHK